VDRAYKCYLQELLASQVRFVVPPFQRRYVWTGAEWRRLWDDLLSTAHSLDGPHHFLGPVVFLHPSDGRSDNTGAARVLDVVDGQQRLITIQMLIAAFRDVAVGRRIKQLAERADALTAIPVAEPVDQPRLTPH
jgi:uncharacterized protein with ParB-like and HNH nuclease domain